MKEVERQLAKAPLSTWKTYLKWQFLHGAADVLASPFEEESFAFYGKYLSGATEMKPRWKRCVENVDGLLGDALGRKYVEKNFPPEAKARMQEMVKNILLAMKDTIGGLTWMGDDTKKKALEKLSTFNPKIGYPDKWKAYAGVVAKRGSFWDDVESASRWNIADSVEQGIKEATPFFEENIKMFAPLGFVPGLTPEQIDAWRIGALLYASLTSRWPGGPRAGLANAPMVGGRVARPRQVRAGVPASLDDLAWRALHDDVPHPLTTPAAIAGVTRGVLASTRYYRSRTHHNA
jgi:hypothetical protein